MNLVTGDLSVIVRFEQLQEFEKLLVQKRQIYSEPVQLKNEGIHGRSPEFEYIISAATEHDFIARTA